MTRRRPPLPMHAIPLLDHTPHRPDPGCPCHPLPGVDLLTPSRTIYWHPGPARPEPDPLEVAMAARLAADAEDRSTQEDAMTTITADLIAQAEAILTRPSPLTPRHRRRIMEMTMESRSEEEIADALMAEATEEEARLAWRGYLEDLVAVVILEKAAEQGSRLRPEIIARMAEVTAAEVGDAAS